MLEDNKENIKQFYEYFERKLIAKSIEKMKANEQVTKNKYKAGIRLPQVYNSKDGFWINYENKYTQFEADILSLNSEKC